MADDIPLDYLHERLDFDPATGVFKWKYWPDAWKGWNERFADAEAFRNPGKDGRRHADLRVGPGGSRFATNASRVAWAMHYGYWPCHEIHHLNGRLDDLRLVNLVDQSHLTNMRSMCRPHTNTSGSVGVGYHKRDKRFRAQIEVHGKSVHLGNFRTIQEARAARAAADQRHGFTSCHGRERG